MNLMKCFDADAWNPVHLPVCAHVPARPASTTWPGTDSDTAVTAAVSGTKYLQFF